MMTKYIRIYNSIQKYEKLYKLDQYIFNKELFKQPNLSKIDFLKLCLYLLLLVEYQQKYKQTTNNWNYLKYLILK